MIIYIRNLIIQNKDVDVKVSIINRNLINIMQETIKNETEKFFKKRNMIWTIVIRKKLNVIEN